MSGILWLDWAITAVSIFNTILLIWLGLTVLLNAEARSWGVWLSSGGLLLGGALFVSHTVFLALGPLQLSFRSNVFWWTVGLVPAIVLPYAWYIIMLWYTGYQHAPDLRRRQRPFLILITMMLLTGLGSLGLGGILLTVPNPQLQDLRLFIRWSIAGIPLLALGYAVYVMVCFGLALDALRRPGPPRRVMGGLARQRAHPWLVGATLALVAVSLMVAGVMAWIASDARRRTFYDFFASDGDRLAQLDLVTAVLVGAAIVMLGQALVAYEVFTGKTLPRQGLRRHWRNTLIMAGVFGVLIGGVITIQLRPLYAIMLATLLAVTFYALFAWQSYAQRDRMMAQLRPFTTSPRLYDTLLTQASPATVDAATPFRALCADVLDARVGYLAALGPIAPLVGPPLAYPTEGKLPATAVAGLSRRIEPETMTQPVDPDRYGGAVWAVPLWSERGLIGVCLLGEKRGGGLYTQEEIELARSTGERLIDTQASAAMARRLMALQRERLAQTQVIDQQTRRVLHDDILPSLQTAMITLGGESPPTAETTAAALTQLGDAHRQISDLLHQMPTTTAPEVARLGLLKALRRTIEAELAGAFDEVVWQIDDDLATQMARLPPLTAEVVYYAAREAARNAARYGRGAASKPFTLTLSGEGNGRGALVVADNGVGMATSATISGQGSGQGLALHSTMMAVIGGSLTVDSVPGQFTRVLLTLPEA